MKGTYTDMRAKSCRRREVFVASQLDLPFGNIHALKPRVRHGKMSCCVAVLMQAAALVGNLERMHKDSACRNVQKQQDTELRCRRRNSVKQQRGWRRRNLAAPNQSQARNCKREQDVACGLATISVHRGTSSATASSKEAARRHV